MFAVVAALQATNATKKVSRARKATAASAALWVGPILTDRQLKMTQMTALAEEMGYTCIAYT